jgi:hypothetical protein
MANKWIDAIGTTLSSYVIGLGTAGLRLKNVAGGLVARNKADTADMPITASLLNASGEAVRLNSDAAGTGSDRTYDIVRPTVQAANLSLLLPDKGTDNFVLRQKAGTAAGVLELELAAPSATSYIPDTTALVFGSTSPVTMFTLPANAQIIAIDATIDTAFNGTPSASIGITGTLSKYLASNQIDLTESAGSTFNVTPGVTPSGTAENLIITYSAGGATAGSARFLVTYTVPA